MCGICAVQVLSAYHLHAPAVACAVRVENQTRAANRTSAGAAASRGDANAASPSADDLAAVLTPADAAAEILETPCVETGYWGLLLALALYLLCEGLKVAVTIRYSYVTPCHSLPSHLCALPARTILRFTHTLSLAHTRR